MWRRVVIGVLCSLWVFSASASATDKAPFPTNYRDLVAEAVKQSFADSYSLRDVFIAAPQWDGPVPGFTDSHAWLVCFRANSRNTQGKYDGIRTYVYTIRNGEVVWYFWEDFTINEVASTIGHELTIANLWSASGWTEQEIFTSMGARTVTAFVHAYCRDAQWQPWPEMEGG